MQELTLPPLTGSPLCTVMIVNYNYERYLPEAIESALAQTYQNFEIVICDDGSKDNSREVISRYAARDPRIRTIFKENAAVAAALNDTFRASRGDIITMLDADDMFRPQKLERVVERLSSGGRVGMVMDTLTKVDSAGMPIGRIPEFGRMDRGELRDAILASAATFSAAPTSGLAMRRECAAKVFPIPEAQFRTEADLYMRTVAALYFAVDVIDEPLTIYRVHSSNVTASQTVDARWCAKVLNANERIFGVLTQLAREHGWHVGRLEDNPMYQEMQLVRACLEGANYRERLRKARDLQVAAGSVEADRLKLRLKAAAIGLGSLLPRPYDRAIFEQVYLPTKLKRSLSGILRRQE